MQVHEKLARLRAAMFREGVDALIVSNSDPHNNEYMAPRWRCREWLTHMEGSAGTALVTQDWCGLWTDSRYYEAAEAAIEGTEVELVRMSDLGVLSIDEWLKANMKDGQTIAFNGEVTDLNQAKSRIDVLTPLGLKIRDDLDLIDALWEDRPAIPVGTLFLVSDEIAGKSAGEKIAELRKEMARLKVDAHLLGRTDESCWLLNFRGTDIKNSPACYCYTLVTASEVVFFIESAKLTDEAHGRLQAAGVTLKGYDEVEAVLSELAASTRLLLVPRHINQRLAKAAEHCVQVTARPIVTDLKAIKNEREVAQLKQALIDDGAAMVRFYVWLYRSLRMGETITELQASRRLDACRAEVGGFRHVSFGSIMGYGPDGALNHYAVDETSDKPVKLESLFLIDSGGNFIHGTTDTTRVIPMGEPTRQQKEDYTLVLGCMLELMILEFPEGTTCAQLDGVCRQVLWHHGRNFKHGTGHGVGFGLEVHEGPQNISPTCNEVMKLGMITTIEPGCYRPGEYGIRIENMVHTVFSKETEFGRFFKFENLTFCPINVDLVEPSLLSSRQLDWLNAYNAEVMTKLSPLLNDEERKWLAHECRPAEVKHANSSIRKKQAAIP